MNKYNPHIHHRRSIRLKGYDYAQAGLYFVTICCDNRICRFGNIDNGEMILNEFGTIAYNEWQKLSERFNNFELDVFQIMPNHIHGIIVLNNVGATLAVAQNGGGDTQNGDVDTQKGGQRNDNIGATARVAPTLDVVRPHRVTPTHPHLHTFTLTPYLIYPTKRGYPGHRHPGGQRLGLHWPC